MKKLLILLCSGFLALSSLADTTASKEIPSWKLLVSHNEAPDWFRDAKFGIYAHWGVYSIPEYSTEWYPRNIHIKNHKTGCQEFHQKTYGKDFKYHDFIPKFTAEKFYADEWAELYERAGAKFGGTVAEHHDGFSMWDSDYTPFNSVDMGPKRDIIRELSTAIRKRGLKFMASYHHSHNPGYFPKHPDTMIPEYAKLYGKMPSEDFYDMWYGKLKECIDLYKPDLMWFDFGLAKIPHEDIRKYFDYYFSNKEDAVITLKNMRWKGIEMDQLRKIAIEDFEKGRLNRLTEYTWLTDDTITNGSWAFTKQMKLKPKDYVLHVLIDIVSKNGQLLLNVAPKADGSIPQDQKEILYVVGDWLKKYGEAIYGTRPFVDFGEGPTRLKKAGHFLKVMKFTNRDFRYTTKGNTLYAIALGKPQKGQKDVLKMFAKDGLAAGLHVKNISMLGSNEKIKWWPNEQGLHINAPADCPNELAVVYKIECSDLQKTVKAALPKRQMRELNRTMVSNGVLGADKAQLKGKRLRTFERNGKKIIGYWKNAGDYIEWSVNIDRPGVYSVSGNFSSAQGDVQLELKAGRETALFDVPSTGNFKKFVSIKSSRNMTFKHGDVLTFSLKAKDKNKWREVNLESIQIEWIDEVD